MSAIISQVSTVLTALVGWIATIVGVFTADGNEVLFMGIAMGLVAFAIGVTLKLLHTNI